MDPFSVDVSMGESSRSFIYHTSQCISNNRASFAMQSCAWHINTTLFFSFYFLCMHVYV